MLGSVLFAFCVEVHFTSNCTRLFTPSQQLLVRRLTRPARHSRSFSSSRMIMIGPLKRWHRSHDVAPLSPRLQVLYRLYSGLFNPSNHPQHPSRCPSTESTHSDASNSSHRRSKPTPLESSQHGPTRRTPTPCTKQWVKK